MQSFDVIVLGLGAMGSAAAWACAQRGWRTLGLEQYDIGHTLGSSHGHSRIIREVYYEHPAYVPLAQEAFRLWEVLEGRTGNKLLNRCRCANIGTPESEIIQGVSQAVHEHSLPAEQWTASDIQKYIPAMQPAENMVAIVEERAGWLAVEQCVLIMQAEATRHGAMLHSKEQVVSWHCSSSHVEVKTNKASYYADKLIITAGPWAASVLQQLAIPLKVMRQMQLWFAPPKGRELDYRQNRFPIFIMDTSLGDFYGIPLDAGPGVKLAQHYGAPELNHPSEVVREFVESDALAVRPFLQQYIPGLAQSPVSASAACIYTLTPDRHFVIDTHPEHRNVAIACGFSGHGFKFAPVIGEMLANLVQDPKNTRASTKDLFSIKRWQVPPVSPVPLSEGE